MNTCITANLRPWGKVTPGEMVGALQDLPLAPKVLPRLKRLLSDTNSTMHEIAMLIRLDPAIAARVIQVANSTYYSKGVRCFTVFDAVNRVGYDQVYELVAYAVASQVLVRPLEVYGLEADDLWRSSVACALAAELLAERMGLDRDAAYTAGLMHAVGMVVIDDWALKNEYDLRLTCAGFPLDASEGERAAFGFTQADTGVVLLQEWDFPSSIYEPLRWQYDPAGAHQHMAMACLLHAAKWVRSTVCQRGTSCPPVPPAVLQLLALGDSVLHELSGVVHDRLTAVSSLLENSVAGRIHADARLRFPRDTRDWLLNGGLRVA